MCISKTINSIGLEVECGIDYEELDKLKDWIHGEGLDSHFESEDDGSVRVTSREYRSAELKFWHSNLDIVKKFMDYLYNECKIKTNKTCGLHIHIKMNDDNYAKLSYLSVVRQFIDKYTHKFRFRRKYITRLVNRNCRDLNHQDILDNQTEIHDRYDGMRYYVVNFISLNVHNSLEFRILPNQVSYSEFEKTIKWFINTLDEILEKPDLHTTTETIRINYESVDKDQTETIVIDKQWCKIKTEDAPKEPKAPKAPEAPIKQQIHAMQLFARSMTPNQRTRTRRTVRQLRSE